ncbi:DUF3422 family protein [Pontibaca salina]|nr:DUF3422 domain-containing protein [Pontibaca salina]
MEPQRPIEEPAPNWSFHDDRETVVTEPHARPSIPVGPQDLVLHLGLKCGEAAQLRLFEILKIDPETINARHWMKQCAVFRSKVEQHTEFTSITLLFPQTGDDASWTGLLAEIAAVNEVEIITLTKVVMEGSSWNEDPSSPSDRRYYGGTMRGGMAVRSTLIPDRAGFITYHVHSPGGTPEATGRRVQRLIEMETYRTLCLLGLPLARRTGDRLAQNESRLINIVRSMGAEGSDDDERLFEALSRLLQSSNAERASTRYRFAASLAYYNLVQHRLTSLEEMELGSLQTITGFVRSRLDPSMATIESVAERQKVLINDLSQALSLLRTRIDLGLNRDNQQLLKSLDARNRQQVLIAQTVEGLSAVAITYYAVGLLSYVLRAVDPVMPPYLPHAMLIAISVPFVLGAVWISLHRMRARWDKHSK